MSIQQSIWSLDSKEKLTDSRLVSEQELEDFIFNDISVLNEDWILLGRQVITDFGGRIDLLCLDRDGDTVIVELKRDLTPREVTAQALDYASCVSSFGSEKLAEIFARDIKFEKTLLEEYRQRFGTELEEDEINTATKMVIVASQMDASTERIIDYLRSFGININVLFFSVFEHRGERLLSRAWLHEEDSPVTKSLADKRDWNGEYYVSFGDGAERSWDDAVKYGFISAGGGEWYTKTLSMLSKGDRIWVNIPHNGYVGVGKVQERIAPASQLRINDTSFKDLKLNAHYFLEKADYIGTAKEEHFVKIDWEKTLPKSSAKREIGFFGNQNTVCRPTTEKWDFTVSELKKLWGILDA